jgi:uncharacterized protein (DUF486 family)
MPRTWSIPVPGFTIRMSLASELIKPGLWPYLMPIIMLFCSNLFMTFAWYGHLKFKVVPLAVVVLVSWGIALVEYCFAVPANRIGSAVYSPAELKTIQEVVTLIVYRDLFRRASELDASCGLCPDRSRGRARVPGPGLSKAPAPRSPDGGSRPQCRAELHAAEDVSHRQDDVGDDGYPKGIGADQGNCDERADDGEHRQNQRNDENRGGRR